MFQEVTLKAAEPVALLTANPLLKSHSQHIAPNQKSQKEVVLSIQIIPVTVAVSSGGRQTLRRGRGRRHAESNSELAGGVGGGGGKVSHFSSCVCSQEQMFEKLQ